MSERILLDSYTYYVEKKHGTKTIREFVAEYSSSKNFFARKFWGVKKIGNWIHRKFDKQYPKVDYNKYSHVDEVTRLLSSTPYYQKDIDINLKLQQGKLSKDKALEKLAKNAVKRDKKRNERLIIFDKLFPKGLIAADKILNKAKNGVVTQTMPDDKRSLKELETKLNTSENQKNTAKKPVKQIIPADKLSTKDISDMLYNEENRENKLKELQIDESAKTEQLFNTPSSVREVLQQQRDLLFERKLSEHKVKTNIKNDNANTVKQKPKYRLIGFVEGFNFEGIIEVNDETHYYIAYSDTEVGKCVKISFGKVEYIPEEEYIDIYTNKLGIMKSESKELDESNNISLHKAA